MTLQKLQIDRFSALSSSPFESVLMALKTALLSRMWTCSCRPPEPRGRSPN